MNKATSLLYADRMQFIVASMTKDYDKARGIANTILEAEPGNTTLRDYLSILEKESNKRKRIHDNVDVSESDSELSVDSNGDGTDSNSNNNSDSDSSSQNSAENKKERDLIEAKKNCQSFYTKNLVFDSGKAQVSQDPSYRHNVEINDAKFRHNELKGKIIRVLPIRLSENIGRTK